MTGRFRQLPLNRIFAPHLSYLVILSNFIVSLSNLSILPSLTPRVAGNGEFFAASSFRFNHLRCLEAVNFLPLPPLPAPATLLAAQVPLVRQPDNYIGNLPSGHYSNSFAAPLVVYHSTITRQQQEKGTDDRFCSRAVILPRGIRRMGNPEGLKSVHRQQPSALRKVEFADKRRDGGRMVQLMEDVIAKILDLF